MKQTIGRTLSFGVLLTMLEFFMGPMTQDKLPGYRGRVIAAPSPQSDAAVLKILDLPVFIVGAPRSGTTWVQRLLLSHPAVCGGQESHFFNILAPVMRTFDKGAEGSRRVGLACYWTTPGFHDQLRALWYSTMAPVVRQAQSPTVLIEKTPAHSLYMKEILRLLPRSRFIHVIRDSRSVVASLLAASRAEWGRGWAPNTAREAAIDWWRCVNAARRAGNEMNPQDYMEVFYEDLSHDPQAEVRRLFDFIEHPLTSEECGEIVERQALSEQKRIGGTPLNWYAGSSPPRHSLPEPAGFLRQGRVDGWKQDLGPWQKLIVWRFTRRLMWECGYTWSGRNEKRRCCGPAITREIKNPEWPSLDEIRD